MSLRPASLPPPVGVRISSDPGTFDLAEAWRLLHTHAHWGRWRSPADFGCQVAAAWRLIHATDETTGTLLGFARATSDGVAVAYVADVFVVPGQRGRGIGHAVVSSLLEDAPTHMTWLLRNADRHSFFQRLGFTSVGDDCLLTRSRRPADDTTGGRSPAPSITVVRPTEVQPYSWGAGAVAWPLRSGEPLDVRVESLPAGGAEELHLHRRVHQFFYVLEGSAEIRTLPDRNLRLSSGEGAHVPPGAAHQVINSGTGATRLLVCSSGPSRADRVAIPSTPGGLQADSGRHTPRSRSGGPDV